MGYTMSELQEFFIKTKEEHKKELEEFKEFQKLLESLHTKKKISYVRHEVTSNT